MMNKARLEELKRSVDWSYRKEFMDAADTDDLTSLIDREIHRIEYRRKVPLLPCRCGNKRPRIRHFLMSRTYKIWCYSCGKSSEYQLTDREARIAWNAAQGKDGAGKGWCRMSKYCSKHCREVGGVCDFCKNYNLFKHCCSKTNQAKEYYEGRNCDDFECFRVKEDAK